MRQLAVIALLAGLAGCLESDTRAVVYYNLTGIPGSDAGDHYRHYASLHGGVAELGCFVIEARQINCFDFDVDEQGNVSRNIFDALVECECPCTATAPDPCDTADGPALVTAGSIRGTLESYDAILNNGGAEFPVQLELGDAVDVFITRQANDDPGPQPAGEVMLSGAVEPNGSVLTGALAAPGSRPGEGRVTIVPIDDGAEI